jgi:Leucine-rich repeat (LRR) protein
MDTLLARRNLAKEANNAQAAIDQKIQTMAASIRETEFSIPVMPIGGDIDLSKLKPLNITSIVSTYPGSITGVTGIPEGVKHFTFERLLLVELPQLPSTLETLNLNANYIESIDLSNLRRLKVARLNGNRLKIVGRLPESLEELYLDNNRIKKLDLDQLAKLRVLHCRNNRTMRIENIPASIVDIQVEDGNPHILLDYAFLPNTAASEENERLKGTETEFVESMHEYFVLKTKYETSAASARYVARKAALSRGIGPKKAAKIAKYLRPKCANCKRPVGTVFKIKEDRFLAYCGDTKEPCPLRIEIFKGQFESDDSFAEYTAKSLMETKEQIIRQKMDVLFNYSSEEDTVKKFKDLIEEYNLLSFLHKTDLDIREDKRFNLHKRELIKTKIQAIGEIKQSMNAYIDAFEETGNRDALHSAMDVYIREYMPEINNLRMLKYSVMEMVVPGTETGTPVRVLNQSAAAMRQLETLHGEVPKVIKFVKGTGAKSRALVKNKEDEKPGEEEPGEGGEEEIPFTPEEEDEDYDPFTPTPEESQE